MPSGAYLFTGDATHQAPWMGSVKEPIRKPTTAIDHGPKRVLSADCKPATPIWEWDAVNIGGRFSTTTSAFYGDLAIRGGTPRPSTRHELSPRHLRSAIPALLGTEPAPERTMRPVSSRATRLPSPRHENVVFDPNGTFAPAMSTVASTRETPPPGSRRAARQQLAALQAQLDEQQRQTWQMRAQAISAARWAPHNPDARHDPDGMPVRRS